MATSKRDVELALRVGVDGAEKVGELAGDMHALAGEGQKLDSALSGGAVGADRLKAELAALSATTKEFRAAEAAAEGELRAAQAVLQEKKDALRLLRIETDTAGKKTVEYQANVRSLRLEEFQAEKAIRDRKETLASASAAAKSAAVAEQQLAVQVTQAGNATRSSAHDLAALPAAGMSWVEFLKGRMGPAMREFAGDHTAAIKKLSAEYAQYKSTGQASMQAVAQTSVAAGSQISDMLRQLGPLLAGTFSAQQFVQTIASYDALKRSFEVMFGSAERAGQELAFVHDMANRLGVENLALAKSYQSLAAATKGTTLEGEQTRAVFEAVVRAMSTLGKSTAETELALRAVQQIASKGSAQMEELRGQLGEQLPGALQAAAKGAGVTTEQLIEMVSAGKVLASDLLPALSKGLNELYGKAAPPDNIVSNWARLKNTFTETAIAIGEGGASSGLAKALSGAAIAVHGASAEVDILGTGLGELAAAVVTGNYELGTGEEIANRYADALRKSAETAGFADKAQTGLTGGMQQGNQTAGEAFRAMERLADKQQQTGESLLKIKAAYGELAKGSKDYTDQIEKEAAARASEGAALLQLVNLYGSEAEKRLVAANVAETQYAAMQRLAQAREVEAIVAQSLAIRLQDEALKRGDTTEATRKEIEAAQKSAAAKNSESEQARATAAAKLVEVEAAKASAIAYQDNAARVYEFRAAAAAASAEVARLTELQKQGKATDEEVAAARVKAAGATRLYRDALADASAAAQRRVADVQQLAQAEQASISLELERVKALREVANANGDAAKAGELLRQETALQVQAAQAQAEASRNEAQAIRDAANAREAELRATGDLTTAKAAEIEAARRNADLKDIEAQKAEILADKIRKLADSEQSRTAALEKQIEAQEKAIALQERQRALEERKKTAYDTAGNVVNAQGETLTSIINTLKGYGLTEEQARQSAQRYINPNGQVNYGPGNSLGGSTLSDTLRILAERTKTAAPAQGAAPTPAATGGTRTVNINIGGRTTPVNVASQTDSDALVGVLRQLENARGTAA